MRSKLFKLAAVILTLVLVTTCFVGGTLAKYVSSAETASSVTVAKWDIEVNGADIAVTNSTPTVTFDLFKTIEDTVATDTNGDDHVITGKIAPGTQGNATLTVANNSEVDASFTIDLAETVSGGSITNLPLEYQLVGQNETLDDNNWSETLSGVSATAIKMNTSATYTLYWRWVFEVNDAGNTTDTAIGIAAAQADAANPVKVEVTATIEVSQVD